MPTLTTNYSLEKPLVNSPVDEDLWGGELNDDLDSIDTLLRAGITVAFQASQTSGFTTDASISVKKLYPCDATGGAFNVTIPAAATAGNGATVFVKKTDSSANAVTLVRSASDTLDGATSLSLSAQNACYGLVSDGVSAWSSIVSTATVPDATTTVKGIVELATAAETLTGTDTIRAITPDAFAGNKTLSTNGYYKLPGGLIWQWGTTSITTNTTAVTFPTAFASTCYNVIVGHGTDSGQNLSASSLTTTGFTLTRGGAQNETAYWQALGV